MTAEAERTGAGARRRGDAGTGVRPARVAVLASGGGTNLQALLERFHGRSDAGTRGRGDAAAGGDPPSTASAGAALPAARVVLVLSDREEAGALERARAAGVETAVVPVAERATERVAEEMLSALEAADAELVVLAGYLKLVPAEVVRRFRGRMLNIHPALLPAFGGKGMYGKRVHRAVLEAGCRVSGATVHLVDERYDTGPILAQWPVPVLPDDSPETLAARVLAVEHRLLPAAVEALAAARRGAPCGPGAGAGTFRYAQEQRPDEDGMRRLLGLE